MNNKRTLLNLSKDIVLATRVRSFCTLLFTNNNIKVVIQINAFPTDHQVNPHADEQNRRFWFLTLYGHNRHTHNNEQSVIFYSNQCLSDGSYLMESGNSGPDLNLSEFKSMCQHLPFIARNSKKM